MTGYKLGLQGLYGSRIELVSVDGLDLPLAVGDKGYLGKLVYSPEGLLAFIAVEGVERIYVINARRIKLL